MSDVPEPQSEHAGPGEPGEHPLSVLLFSWMRTKLFFRVLLIGLGVVGVGLIGLDVWMMHRPVKDVTSGPGFYGVFGFLAFGLAVLSGWPLGRLLRRPETYYDTRSGEVGRDR
jgi:hypothetical protein